MRWRTRVVISSGSPSVTIRFASLPASMAPTRSAMPSISAAFTVTARSAASRGRPYGIAMAASYGSVREFEEPNVANAMSTPAACSLPGFAYVSSYGSSGPVGMLCVGPRITGMRFSASSSATRYPSRAPATISRSPCSSAKATTLRISRSSSTRARTGTSPFAARASASSRRSRGRRAPPAIARS